MKFNFIIMMAMLTVLTITGSREAVAGPVNFEKLSLPENVTLEMVKINPGSFNREWNLDKISPELRKNIHKIVRFSFSGCGKMNVRRKNPGRIQESVYE